MDITLSDDDVKTLRQELCERLLDQLRGGSTRR
jgi:hypothetical protein